MPMSQVYLGFGSNVGDRLQNIITATHKLSANNLIKDCSSIWETSPWGLEQQEDFLNCVILFETNLSPFTLIEAIGKIEHSLGRKKEQKFGPRTIDIDILFFDTLIINTPTLIVPHPLLHRRKFVLLPLSEIAPTEVKPPLLHPILKKEINELMEDLASNETCHLFIPADRFRCLINTHQV
ncbi:MAG: 2-amino-4-hydroxy-6-hydroxymethyldihydropteridine diphosphokinase [Candidatus Stahlbacteria bacterium]|nr:2-amino-4-hydroxy-6-hydroxymethyldihydropteridine diphosphokinase [Candidatus Stahlbacteria bacterium]